MSSDRLEFYRRRLELYLEAEETVLRGQAYKIGSRAVTRADLRAIQDEIHRLEGLLKNGGKGKRTIRIVPRDL